MKSLSIPPRRSIRARYLLAAVSIFVAEVLIATVFARFTFVRSYIGDYLVVILLYFLVKVFWEAPPLRLSAGIFLFACGIEVLQYFQIVDRFGIPSGSWLAILVGSSFSWMDILMYFLGSLTAYLCDNKKARLLGAFFYPVR